MKSKSFRICTVFVLALALAFILPMAAFASSDNAPETLKVGDVLDSYSWSDGNSWFDINGPSVPIGEFMFELAANDTVATLISKIDSASNGFYSDLLSYDSASGQYIVGSGKDGDSFTLTQWDNKYCDKQLGDKVTLTSIVAILNAYTVPDPSGGDSSGSGSASGSDTGSVGMPAVIAAMDIISNLLSSVWLLMTSNALLTVFLAAGLVSVGVSVFRSIKHAAQQ